MRRIATLGVAGCTLALAMCWAMEVAVACVNDIFPELKEHAAAIARLREQRESFETKLGAIAVEVALGRQSLRDASAALEKVAIAQYPPYLRYIRGSRAHGAHEAGRSNRVAHAGHGRRRAPTSRRRPTRGHYAGIRRDARA
jgi:hypothetical protein